MRIFQKSKWTPSIHNLAECPAAVTIIWKYILLISYQPFRQFLKGGNGRINSGDKKEWKDLGISSSWSFGIYCSSLKSFYLIAVIPFANSKEQDGRSEVERPPYIPCCYVLSVYISLKSQTLFSNTALTSLPLFRLKFYLMLTLDIVSISQTFCDISDVV